MHISKVKEGWFIIPRKDILNSIKKPVMLKGVKYIIYSTFPCKMPSGDTILMISRCEANVTHNGKMAHEFLVKDSPKINRNFKFFSLERERIAKIKSILT